MDAITVPALLSGAVTALASALVFLFLRLEKLNSDHKQELRENGKALAEMVKQLTQAIERLSDLEERRHQ